MRWPSIPWSDRTLGRVGRTLSLLSIASALIGFGLVATAGRIDQAIDNYGLLNWVMAFVYGLLGLLLIRSETRNRAAWLIVGAGVASAIPSVISSWWDVLASDLGVAPGDIDSSEWPTVQVVLFALGRHTWIFSSWGAITLGLLLTPDGRLPSRRWRPVAATSVLVMVVAWLWLALSFPVSESVTLMEQNRIFRTILALPFTVLGPLSLASFVVRYRRAEPSLRRQLRWVLYGGLVAIAIAAIIAVGLTMASFGLVSEAVFLHPGWLFALYPVLAVSYGMAIWRDQLFDIDRLIARTLLYAALATFIGAVYVGVVFGVGALLGQTSGDRSALSLAATVAVAFGFQPVRRRLERAANRLVYGDRATPYEVLADLSARLTRAESADGLLDRMVALLGQATGADRAVAWRIVPDDNDDTDLGGATYESLAVWPPGETAIPGVDDLGPDRHLATIERAGQTLGALTVTKPAREDLTPTERRLLDDLAGSAGLVLDRARLDAALAAQADALAHSRRRLVGAQSEERRRLERQLADGTQRHLRSLATGLDDGARRAAAAELGPVGQQLDVLAAEIRTAGEEIAALARGMYPPVLEAEGLLVAVRSLAAGLPIEVTVEGHPAGRLGVDVELAVYFSIAEALTNVVKHAKATAAVVRLDRSGDELRFEVVDDGRGFEVGRTNGSSTGLAGLRDRIDTVGGSITVRSHPGAGTTVTGSVPVTAAAAMTAMATVAVGGDA
ncbi:MAG: ATP-binding protein [Actinomycetota bacterium]